MKKHLLLVCLFSAVVFYGYSQSLSLSNASGPIAANSIITQAGTPDSTELVTYLHVTNNGSNSLSVLCKKVCVLAKDSTEVTMCWAGGCYPAFVNVSPNAATIGSGQTAIDFSGHYATTTSHGIGLGVCVVRWVFFDENNINDSVSVTVKYTTYPVGMDEKSSEMLSNIYPNPAGTHAACTFSVPASSQGMIIVRNLVGTTVLSEAVEGNGKLTLNTAGLSDGIYFCSLMLDGKISQTKKLVVKH